MYKRRALSTRVVTRKQTKNISSRMGAEGSRLLREKQQLKIPQKAYFAFEEAEVLSAESDFP